MKKSREKKVNSTTNNMDELLEKDRQTADDIPIDWLPKNEPITRSMSYKNSNE